jgi:hypothetical protein
MKLDFKLILCFLFCFQIGFSQENDNAALLKILLTKYYANEKPIVKNRLQLLSFYCDKAPNNEEILEVINSHDLLKKNSAAIKKQINASIQENWNKEFELLFANQNQYLKSKVQNCYSLEDFQKISTAHSQNNQRLMIVNKPIYFATNYCLVKVGFYRNVEHNSARYILFEKRNGVWTIKETLNEWNT